MRFDAFVALRDEVVDRVHRGHAGFEVQVRGQVQNALDQQVGHAPDVLTGQKPVQLVDRLALHRPHVVHLDLLQQVAQTLLVFGLQPRGVRHVELELGGLPLDDDCGGGRRFRTMAVRSIEIGFYYLVLGFLFYDHLLQNILWLWKLHVDSLGVAAQLLADIVIEFGEYLRGVFVLDEAGESLG